MSSWSENRSKAEKWSKETKEQKLRQINGVLGMLSKDEDLQDDLKSSDVIRAIKHWTNVVRLPPEEAAKFQDNRRIMYVMQKFQILQSVCQEAGIPVPLDHLTSQKSQLSEELTVKFFGEEFSGKPVEKVTQVFDKPKIVENTISQRKSATKTSNNEAASAKAPTTNTTNSSQSANKESKTAESKAHLQQPATKQNSTPKRKRNTECLTFTVLLTVTGSLIYGVCLAYGQVDAVNLAHHVKHLIGL